jgi:23S rRNA (guanosine2251-2'-O)-methyltransferase
MGLKKPDESHLFMRQMMKKKIRQKDVDLVFGIHPIIELLKAKKRKIYSIYTTKPEPKAWKYIKQLLPKKPIPIRYVVREALHKISGTTDHQGVVVCVQPFVFAKTFFNPRTHPFILLLDGIQDVGNLGALLRSAYCTNCDGVIICKKGGAPLTAAAFNRSAGLAEHLTIYQASSVIHAVQELKKAGYHLYLATLDGKDVRTVHFRTSLCLVIGNEAVGITKSILSEGEQITLAQRKADISYNASVAAGILLFLIASSLQKI